MRFMIIRKADANTEAAALPSEELVEAMMNYIQEMLDAGVFLQGMGLQPSVKGSRVTFDNGTPTVIDGPFTETKELIAGLTLIEAGSKEEAIEWVKRWPIEDGDVELELRQVYEVEDLGEGFTPELREKEERIRTEGAARL